VTCVNEMYRAMRVWVPSVVANNGSLVSVYSDACVRRPLEGLLGGGNDSEMVRTV